VKVLLRTPNWIGDAVLALPAVAALAARPDVRLTVLASPYVHPIYEGLPGAALSPIDPRARNVLQAFSVGRALVGDDEVGIALPASFSSALILWVAGIPRRVGRTTDARALLLTERLPPPPEPLRPLRAPAAPSPRADGAPPEGARRDGDPRPRSEDRERRFHRWRDYAEVVERVLEEEVVERYPLRVSPEAAARSEPLLAELAGRGPLIGLNPGANWPSRRWPPERYGALGRLLREALDARVAVLGGRQELDLARRVAEAVPGARSLAGRTDLKALMAILSRLDLLVTNDTGPMHVAAALGTPLVDLCGAADERVTGPRGPRSRVLREHLFCSPCVKNVCPYHLECMEALTVRRVFEEALSSLGTGWSA
jgi:heptosyltransferase-2